MLNTNGLEDRAQTSEEITFLAEWLSSLLLLHLLLIASPQTHIAKMQKCLWFYYVENQWLVGLPVSLPLSLFCSAEDKGGGQTMACEPRADCHLFRIAPKLRVDFTFVNGF